MHCTQHVTRVDLSDQVCFRHNASETGIAQEHFFFKIQDYILTTNKFELISLIV